MHKIEVDDEVFAYLQLHARPFVDNVNDVLRRLLLKEGSHLTAEQGPRRTPGDLMPLIEAKLIEPHDQLVHVQLRRGVEHYATVTPDGYLEMKDGRIFSKPSPALKHCVGTEVNGWAKWSHVRSGRRLEDLRDQLRRHR